MTVFTCMIGDTDTLQAPTVVNPAVRYVCLTDRARVPAPYVRVTYAPAGLDTRLASRRVKILADHPALDGAAVTLWHDAAFQLRCDPQVVADQALKAADVVAFRHPHRDQIEDEAVAIARLGYMPTAVLQAQIAKYRSDGFTQQAITSTGFCLRRHTAEVRAFNAAWWMEVVRWGWRDQMSVDYALWACGMMAHYIPGHYRDNPHAKFHVQHPRAGAC